MDREPPADPEKRFFDEERKRLVRQAMDRENNPDLRETARLFYEEELAVAEIALRLGLTVTAVTTRLDRFRGRMRKRLLRLKLDEGEV
jgi:RNA polymerase sigma factor (sigma-70 family)